MIRPISNRLIRRITMANENKTINGAPGRAIKHPKVYRCKRYKLYAFLLEKGFEPFSVQIDNQNPRFINWMYGNTPELEDAIDEYFGKSA